MRAFSKKGQRWPALVSAGASIALALTGCSGGQQSAGSSSGEHVLTLGATSNPVSLDPMLQNVDPINLWFVNLAYDSLVHVDSATGDLKPDLATEWKYTDSTNQTLQLTLREGVKFSDGSALDSKDVVASLEYARKSGVNKAWLKDVDNVTAVDAKTVQVHSNVPNDALPFLLSQRLLLGSVVSEEGLSNPSTLLNKSQGAGPYVLDPAQTVSNDSYVYVPNQNYWDKSKIKWDKVVIKVVANRTAALQAVQNKQIDIFRADATTAAAAQKANLGIATAPAGLYGVNYVDRAGALTPQLADLRVRQALSYAIDRQKITQAVYGDYADPSASLTLRGFTGYSDEDAKAFPYDVDKAKKLLADAGYAGGFSFKMATTVTGNANLMAQAVVENWKAIGVSVDLTTYDNEGQLVTDVTGQKYSAAVYAYGALPLFIQAQSFFTGGATQYNPFNTQDTQINADLASAAQASGHDAQDKLYNSALHRATVDLAWMSNIFVTKIPMVYASDRVKGVEISPLNISPDAAWEMAPAK